MAAAIVASALAVVAVVVGALLTAPWLRDELRGCQEDRLRLHRRVDLLTTALLGLLPRHDRDRLLAAIDDETPPRAIDVLGAD